MRASVSDFAKHSDAIVDALGFTDSELNSDLASQNPYEALWKTAQQSELNNNEFMRAKILAARGWKKDQRSSPKL